MNVPLLGFSLRNIAFRNENEFETRVVHNNRALGPIGSCGTPPMACEKLVERVVGEAPDVTGMIRLTNRKSATTGDLVHARAKGVFGKASDREQELLVQFEYLPPCG